MTALVIILVALGSIFALRGYVRWELHRELTSQDRIELRRTEFAARLAYWSAKDPDLYNLIVAERDAWEARVKEGRP